tara:strand:+ start:1141 stop:1596 length:456 start_codon:yes stop_codon:yes gene_type:complete
MELDLVKVFIDLPADEPFETEAFWAKKVGDSIYNIENVPFFSYEVHFNDIVEAIPIESSSQLKIIKIVKPSNRFETRVVLNNFNLIENQEKLLYTFSLFDLEYEHAKNGFFAISLAKKSDISKFERALIPLVSEDLISYDAFPFEMHEKNS